MQSAGNNINVDSTAGKDITNIIIRNCTVSLSGASGIGISNWANRSADHPITKCIIDNNVVHHNRNHGIVFSWNVKNSSIKRNKVYENCWNESYGYHGISSWSNDSKAYPSGNIIEYNEVYNQYKSNNKNNGEGAGIQLDDYTRSTIVRYNIVHNNEGSGIVDHGVGGIQNNYWYYNIVYENGIAGEDAGMWIGKSNNIFVFNNTFLNNYSGIQIINNSTGVKLKNNIFSENMLLEIRISESAHIDFESDYNLVHHPDSDAFMQFKGVNYNWPNWKIKSKQDAHSINSDPHFKNINKNDFTLQSISPAIDAALHVGLKKDFAGNAILQNNHVDIGAFEYKDSTVMSPVDNLRITSPKNE
jgi:hypothetical protein